MQKKLPSCDYFKTFNTKRIQVEKEIAIMNDKLYNLKQNGDFLTHTYNYNLNKRDTSSFEGKWQSVWEYAYVRI